MKIQFEAEKKGGSLIEALGEIVVDFATAILGLAAAPLLILLALSGKVFKKDSKLSLWKQLMNSISHNYCDTCGERLVSVEQGWKIKSECPNGHKDI